MSSAWSLASSRPPPKARNQKLRLAMSLRDDHCVSSDGSAGSRLTNDISQIMGQLPDTVEALTGVNLKRVMKRLEGPVGAAVKTAVEATD